MLRGLAEVTQQRGEVSTATQITSMLEDDFFVPIATSPHTARCRTLRID